MYDAGPLWPAIAVLMGVSMLIGGCTTVVAMKGCQWVGEHYRIEKIEPETEPS
ncbi:MAG: hypothetical protein AAF532_17400 [Planctomycetota bacterium]